jgi:homoserine kinase
MLQELNYGWRVVVPASSANLGCAFDCAGLALKLYLTALFLPSSDPGLLLEYQGRPPAIPVDDSNLILKAMRFAAAALDAPPLAGRVLVESEIPAGVGLGSSAAAVIAGLLLGSRCAGKRVSDEILLRWAEELEGHIDNAAAAYRGGLVFALSQNVNQLLCLKSSFPEHIRLLVVTPQATVISREARKALPHSYAAIDVFHTLQRTAMLAATCFSGRFELLPELFDDRLHQPYRQKLVPGIERCLKLRMEGLLGCAISGSGSSVIAFIQGNHQRIGDALQRAFAEEGLQSECLLTAADNDGAWISRVPVTPGVPTTPRVSVEENERDLCQGTTSVVPKSSKEFGL